MKTSLIGFSACFFLFGLFISSCKNKLPGPISNSMVFLPKLSDYGIYQGNLANLIPAARVEPYELATPLFTDYAEKQRLIRLPVGAAMIARGDGLPQLPAGTMLVKTFYYPNDAAGPSKGKRILETRLLIKHDSLWNVATYQWNDSQTDAFLTTAGANVPLTWRHLDGTTKTITYHIPSSQECTSCHRSAGEITPIGPKLRNLNRTIEENGIAMNQLQRLRNKGLLNPLDPLRISALPTWDSPSASLTERARAYLDVNCAHCHQASGWAASTHLRFEYELPLESTRITERTKAMLKRMESPEAKNRMPKLGVTTPHKEGIDLIKRYIETL